VNLCGNGRWPTVVAAEMSLVGMSEKEHRPRWLLTGRPEASKFDLAEKTLLARFAARQFEVVEEGAVRRLLFYCTLFLKASDGHGLAVALAPAADKFGDPAAMRADAAQQDGLAFPLLIISQSADALLVLA